MTILTRLRRLFRLHVIADITDPVLDTCESCRVPNCTGEVASRCEAYRLALAERQEVARVE